MKLNQYLLNIKGNSVVEQTLRETPQDNRLIDQTAFFRVCVWNALAVSTEIGNQKLGIL